MSPATGPVGGGNVVTVDGTGFTGATAVSFGGTPSASFIVAGDSELSAAVPPGTVGVVDVTVTSPLGTSALVVADQYAYAPTPTITSFSPTVGPRSGGGAVVITGTFFTGASAVRFTGVASASIAVNSDTQITAIVPSSFTGTIAVDTPGGTATSADVYTFLDRPDVATISPIYGPTTGGNSITINGGGFVMVSAVNFGTVPASTYTVNSATSITATAPPNSAGTIVDITVTTPGGVNLTSGGDQYTYYAIPVITSILPASGPNSGGTDIEIVGSGFTGVSSGTLGGIACPSFIVDSDTNMRVVSPVNAAPITGDVRLTGPGGTSAITAADQFTYNGIQVIDSTDANKSFVGSTGNDTFQVTANAGTPNSVDGVTGSATIAFIGKHQADIVSESTASGLTTITFSAGSGGQTLNFKNVASLSFTGDSSTQTPPYPTIP